MTETKTTNIIIALLILGTVVISTLAFFTSMADNYGVEADTEAFESTYNKVTELNRDIEEAQNKTTRISADNEAQFFTGVWPITQLMLSFIGSMLDVGMTIITGAFSSITGLRVPTAILSLISGIFFLLVVGAIVALIRGRST